MTHPTSEQTATGQEALRAAVEAHYMPLLRLCVLLSGSEDTAEDIVQEAFVRAAPRLEGLEPEKTGPYLRRTAVNLWKNRVRRLIRERRARSTHRPDPPAESSMVEDRADLWRALVRLPDRQRACLVLRFYEDLPEKVVAEVLGCSVGTVKSHTSRGLARLRKELG